MDFYSQEDDWFTGDSTAKGDEENADFCCEVCGGTESYLKDESGVLCCASCFTQSQVAVRTQETQMDFEDIMAFAARGRGGNVKVTKHGKGTGRRGPEKVPMETYDISQKLPSLQLCMHGMQRVLLEGGKILCQCLDLTDVSLQMQVLRTIQDVWTGYVRAWADGAEYYGKLNPEMRFSLRDFFLFFSNGYVKRLLHSKLSYDAYQKLQAEENHEPSETATENDDQVDDGDDEIEDANDDEEHDKGEGGVDKAGPEKRSLTFHSFLRKLLKGVPKGRKEVALQLQPSMSLAAAILWVAVHRFGVTPAHISFLISNGSLPLLNAFRLLTAEEQSSLALISGFFRMSFQPRSSTIEYFGQSLLVACGIKSIEQLKGSKDQPKDKPVPTKQDTIKLKNLPYVTEDSAPLVAARMVADLRLGQRVLDLVLCMMGHRNLIKSKESKQWLPPPLKATNPQHITSLPPIAGAIVAACKMMPRWERWSYGLGSQSSKSVVPWTEEELRCLTNRHLEGYLKFVETSFLDVGPSTEASSAVGAGYKDDDDNEVRPCPILSGWLHPNALTKRLQRPIRYTPLRAGLGVYISYKYKDSHTNARSCTPDPFHAQYSRLVEYVAYKTHLEPAEIHAAVVPIDLELVGLYESTLLDRSDRFCREKRIYNSRRTRPSKRPRVEIVQQEEPPKKRRGKNAKKEESSSSSDEDELPRIKTTQPKKPKQNKSANPDQPETVPSTAMLAQAGIHVVAL